VTALRIAVACDDLLFASRLLSSLAAAGNDAELVPVVQVGSLLAEPAERETANPFDVVIVDLEALASGALSSPCRVDVPAVGFYPHVRFELRALGERLGFAVVVPRSRLVRDVVALAVRAVERAGVTRTRMRAGEGVVREEQ